MQNREEDSEDDSAYDSEVDPERNENPVQLMKFKEKVRSRMLAKSKNWYILLLQINDIMKT